MGNTGMTDISLTGSTRFADCITMFKKMSIMLLLL